MLALTPKAVQPALGLLLLASIVVALTIGPADIAPSDIWQATLFHLGWADQSALTPVRNAIIWELRLPRILAAAATGAGLAMCGAVMQALTRNPLADPYLLGLSAGASCGAVLCLLAGAAFLLPFGAFLGALAAMGATLLTAQVLGGATPTRTILGGIAVSALASAFASFMIFWSATGDSYREILSWLMGSLSGVVWPEAWAGIAVVVGVGTPVLLFARTLDAFAFGEHAAASLGVNVVGSRWLLLGAIALVTGILVAVSGSIGFVGLVVPHVARFITGARHRLLLPTAMLIGACFMLWADTAARCLFDPRELPVGIITALAGAPVFIMVLLRYRRLT